MAERVRLYAGTERGLSVWREGSNGWEPVGSGIPSRRIVVLPRQPLAVKHKSAKCVTRSLKQVKRINNDQSDETDDQGVFVNV